jgi:16S rRNA (guanine1516-N2)-methyltransferase
MKFKAQWPQRKKMGSIDDPIKKAIGFKKDQQLKVLDLTGGLFRDAFHMASMGCDVTALEEVEDLAKAYQELLKVEPVSNLEIQHTSSEDYLSGVSEGQYDVAYYDPMFPEKKKSALPGKEAQFLQSVALAKTQEQEEELLSLCLSKFKRVVVKRPLRAEALLKPSHSIKGKSVRFDVYLN